MADDDIRAQLAHLHRRAGFGATPAQLDAGVAGGFAAAVAGLLDALDQADAGGDAVPAPKFAVAGAAGLARAAADQGVQAGLRADAKSLQLWWLDRMAASTAPMREKLTLLWHGHFATGIQKVRLAAYMYGQNQTFRTLGGGSFETLTQAVAKDPAMLLWLDSNTNSKNHPNENFARELMELFTLGIGNYNESDVKEAARAFTGWSLSRQTDSYLFRPGQHDTGIKTVLGHAGNFGGEDVITLLTHSPAGARWVVARVWSHLVYPVSPSDPVVTALASSYAADLDVKALLRAVLLHPQFLSAQARSGLVKQPIEYVVGAFRALGLKPSDHPEVLPVLTGLGQTPFDPPSVGGWPQNGYWLSTAAALTRWRFAALLAARADVTALAAIGPAERPAALARLLSVTWTPATSSALARSTDVRQALALSLVAPEYVLN